MRWVVALTLALLVVPAGAEDWGAARAAFDPAVVARYKQILARDPHDEAVLRALTALYRRYRTAAALEAEYRGAAPDWANLVVLARLTRDAAVWQRAVAARPADARTALAAGDAAREPATARDYYRAAAEHCGDPRCKRAALTKLAGAARTLDDAATTDRAYAELLSLFPRDGALWLERGHAQLAAQRHADAIASFAAAEPLLRADPERRFAAMTTHGLALDRLGRGAEAVAQLERTLDQLPRGYHLGRELVAQIVDIERRRHELATVTARFEKRWPAATRGHFEWSTLGALYLELRDDERAIAAYQRAVARAPFELETQRALIDLLDRVHPERALAAHEAAARIAPGDLALQLGLARRYHLESPARAAKAFIVLDALRRRLPRDVGLHDKLAELYEEWNEPRRAIAIYATLADLEPRDPERALVLGDALWRAGERDRAFAAWDRLDAIGTLDAVRRHADQLALRTEWERARVAYGKAIALDGTDVASRFGRARALEALGDLAGAAAEARRAIALTGPATQSEGLRERVLLVRALRDDELAATLARWRFAFERGDVDAGYLLVTYHERFQTAELHATLVALYRRVPTDDALGIAVARSYERRGDFAEAREELERIAARSPARRDAVLTMIAGLEAARAQYERDKRWEEQGGGRGRAEPPDLVGSDDRFGGRFALGGDVAGAAGTLFGIGVYVNRNLANGLAFTYRLDWAKRNELAAAASFLGLAGAISKRLVDARSFELAGVAGARGTVRYHRGTDTPWRRAGLGAEVSLELIPRALPATIGVRFSQELTDRRPSSAVVLELGVEVR